MRTTSSSTSGAGYGVSYGNNSTSYGNENTTISGNFQNDGISDPFTQFYAYGEMPNLTEDGSNYGGYGRYDHYGL